MKQLIVAAGMPRSGSTWLYNVCRLILSSCETIDLGYGWIADFDSFKNHETVLLKIHDYEPVIAKNASVLVYSFRDIRDVLVSCQRKFNMIPSVELAKKYVENDYKWREKSSFIMRYEDMLEDPDSIIVSLSKIFGRNHVNINDIKQSVSRMKYESDTNKHPLYNQVNLLHKNHIIDGRHGAWKGHISDKLVGDIERECSEWMEENNYF